MKTVPKKATVIKDCFCEEYLNERTRHWRPGIKEKRLSKGDEVVFIKFYTNLFGKHAIVEKDGEKYYVNPFNLMHE